MKYQNIKISKYRNIRFGKRTTVGVGSFFIFAESLTCCVLRVAWLWESAACKRPVVRAPGQRERRQPGSNVSHETHALECAPFQNPMQPSIPAISLRPHLGHSRATCSRMPLSHPPLPLAFSVDSDLRGQWPTRGETAAATYQIPPRQPHREKRQREPRTAPDGQGRWSSAGRGRADLLRTPCRLHPVCCTARSNTALCESPNRPTGQQASRLPAAQPSSGPRDWPEIQTIGDSWTTMRKLQWINNNKSQSINYNYNYNYYNCSYMAFQFTEPSLVPL